jgi:hypothetical protein
MLPRHHRTGSHPHRLRGAHRMGQRVRRIDVQPGVNGGVATGGQDRELPPRTAADHDRGEGAQIGGVVEDDLGNVVYLGGAGERPDQVAEPLRALAGGGFRGQ